MVTSIAERAGKIRKCQSRGAHLAWADWHAFHTSHPERNPMRFVVVSIVGLSLLVPLSTPLHAGSPPTSCQSAAYRQFDFFAGDWDAYSLDAPSKVVARNRVSVILDGCVIYEDYQQNDGLHGKSFSIYDTAQRQWHQSWVTNRGDLLLLDGHLANGTMKFLGQHRTASGKQEIVRVVWQPAGHDVRETAAHSLDDGKTWQPMFDIVFKPHR